MSCLHGDSSNGFAGAGQRVVLPGSSAFALFGLNVCSNERQAAVVRPPVQSLLQYLERCIKLACTKRDLF